MKGRYRRRKIGFQPGHTINSHRTVTEITTENSVHEPNIKKYVRLPRDLHEKVFRGSLEQQVHNMPNVTALRPTAARLSDAELCATAVNNG